MQPDDMEQVLADAARWDWVRSRYGRRFIWHLDGTVGWHLAHIFPRGETLDAAVDAEMAEEAKRQGGEV